MKPVLLPLAAALAFGMAPAAMALPCAQSAIAAQSALDAYIDTLAATGPSAPESTGALLSHDPSPASLARTEAELGDGTQPEVAQKALERARAAEVKGDIAACEEQVAKARAVLRAR